jgi:CRISPR system Cascade subunit CasE
MSTATLARVRLNPRSRAVQRDLGNAVGMHKTMMRLLPDHLGERARATAGLLFRLDETPKELTLLVQSRLPIDPRRLPADYGHVATRDLAPMFTALKRGTAVRYRITASAIRRPRPTEGEKKPPAVALLGAEAEEWWTQRAQQAGLLIHTAASTRLRPATSARVHNDAVYHALTRFDGLATVTDPDALGEAILTGIGKGKPYGAGLLSLAPAELP